MGNKQNILCWNSVSDLIRFSIYRGYRNKYVRCEKICATRALTWTYRRGLSAGVCCTQSGYRTPFIIIVYVGLYNVILESFSIHSV